MCESGTSVKCDEPLSVNHSCQTLNSPGVVCTPALGVMCTPVPDAACTPVPSDMCTPVPNDMCTPVPGATGHEEEEVGK